MEEKEFDSYGFVLKYIDLSLELADKGLILNEFNSELYRRLSDETGINEKNLANIVQPLSHLHFFQNRNGDSGSWADSWIDYFKDGVKITKIPSNTEKDYVTRNFLRMYGEELEGRKRFYDVLERLSNSHHEQS